MPTIRTVETGIDGAAVELQSIHGGTDGAVLHMLPGGVLNPEGFGLDLRDIYAFTAKGRSIFRGGHYHLKLDELFFQMSGTALWILSDFREGSRTNGKTVGIVIGMDAEVDARGLPRFLLTDGSLPRVRVPAGVYHAMFPLTDERVTCVGIGSTAYDKEDYRYPAPDDVSGMKEMLERFDVRM